MCMRTTRHRGKLKQYMSLYRVFAWQPCWMAVTIRFLFSGKLNLFLCKTFSLFLPSNMAAMQSLYSNPKHSLTCPVNRIAAFVTTVYYDILLCVYVHVHMYRVFKWQPCWMVVTIRFLFSGKLN